MYLQGVCGLKLGHNDEIEGTKKWHEAYGQEALKEPQRC